MGNVRVFQLARDLDLPSQEVIDRLKKLRHGRQDRVQLDRRGHGGQAQARAQDRRAHVAQAAHLRQRRDEAEREQQEQALAAKIAAEREAREQAAAAAAGGCGRGPQGRQGQQEDREGARGRAQARPPSPPTSRRRRCCTRRALPACAQGRRPAVRPPWTRSKRDQRRRPRTPRGAAQPQLRLRPRRADRAPRLQPSHVPAPAPRCSACAVRARGAARVTGAGAPDRSAALASPRRAGGRGPGPLPRAFAPDAARRGHRRRRAPGAVGPLIRVRSVPSRRRGRFRRRVPSARTRRRPRPHPDAGALPRSPHADRCGRASAGSRPWACVRCRRSLDARRRRR